MPNAVPTLSQRTDHFHQILQRLRAVNRRDKSMSKPPCARPTTVTLFSHSPINFGSCFRPCHCGGILLSWNLAVERGLCRWWIQSPRQMPTWVLKSNIFSSRVRVSRIALRSNFPRIYLASKEYLWIPQIPEVLLRLFVHPPPKKN